MTQDRSVQHLFYFKLFASAIFILLAIEVNVCYLYIILTKSEEDRVSTPNSGIKELLKPNYV